MKAEFGMKPLGQRLLALFAAAFLVSANTPVQAQTAGEMAQAMKTVRDAAPDLAESAVGVAKSADGIAADVHSITADMAKPKGFWAKFRAWLETAGKVAARFI